MMACGGLPDSHRIDIFSAFSEGESRRKGRLRRFVGSDQAG